MVTPFVNLAMPPGVTAGHGTLSFVYIPTPETGREVDDAAMERTTVYAHFQ